MLMILLITLLQKLKKSFLSFLQFLYLSEHLKRTFMKKLFLVAIATVGFAYTGTAQEVTFGVKGGVNNTNFTGDLESDPKTSFYLGGFVDLGITEAFHIQPELLYSSEGAADDAGLTYLKVPVMLNIMQLRVSISKLVLILDLRSLQKMIFLTKRSNQWILALVLVPDMTWKTDCFLTQDTIWA